MKKLLLFALLLTATVAGAQTFEDKYSRSLSDVLNDVAMRFGVKLKYNVDTTGLRVTYADFRIRPYSVEETLQNILAPLDLVANKQTDTFFKIKPYEYPRRVPADGQKLITYLYTQHHDRNSWESRRTQLKSEVRESMQIDPLLAACATDAPTYGAVRQFDGYTVQNFRLRTVGNHYVCGSIYAPAENNNDNNSSGNSSKSNKSKNKNSKDKHPLIICPNGHFANGRYGEVQQLRLGTLARMGAVCVDYDLWGWGESEDEVGTAAHQTTEAHRMQAVNGIRILDWMIQRPDIDTSRIGCNGGSGGGSQVVLLTTIDDRYTASNPVVSMSSWFDGGCPCESGMPIQLSGGGTCNPELAATFAPKPMMIVSDGGDWTSTTPELEYPYVKHIYNYYGAADKVTNIHLPDERHDFGPNKRQAVYQFFISAFGLDAAMLDESKITIESEAALRYDGPKDEKDEDSEYAVDLVQPGTVAPAFTINDTDGQPHTLAEMSGKWVVLDFWASWCPDCRKDVPRLKELHERYGNQVQFVSISLDDNRDNWTNYIAKSNMTWLQLSELKKKKDSKVCEAYGVKWIPAMVLIAPDGTVSLSTVMISKLAAKLKEIAQQ